MYHLKVTLEHSTPLSIATKAIRTCYDSFSKSDNMGCKDLELIDRVGNKKQHKSVLEHLYYNFYITGLPRYILQKLARHRIASMSCKSTEYTLKELNQSVSLLDGNDINFERANKYLFFGGNRKVFDTAARALERLRIEMQNGVSIHDIKDALPESYRCNLMWSVNCRELQHVLDLRGAKQNNPVIIQLSKLIIDAIPSDHKYLYSKQIEALQPKTQADITKALQAERGAVYGDFSDQVKAITDVVTNIRNYTVGYHFLKKDEFIISLYHMVQKITRLAVTNKHIDSAEDLLSYAELHKKIFPTMNHYNLTLPESFQSECHSNYINNAIIGVKTLARLYNANKDINEETTILYLIKIITKIFDLFVENDENYAIMLDELINTISSLVEYVKN